MKLRLKKIFKIVIYIFAVIGFVLVAGYLAVRFGFTNTKGIIDEQNKYFLNNTNNTFAWNQGEEWQTFKDAVVKDKVVLDRIEIETGIKERVLVSALVVEQLRLFYSERESFKKFFAPLKILGVQSQFSQGVMGIKTFTAEKTEKNLKDSTSPFYLGKVYENMLDFKTGDIETERFTRLTDPHDRYYQYLYSALYFKEIITQWKNSGFNISENPGVLATLYNIGFDKSIPNASPKIGGAEIDIGVTKYSFGGLAYEFYYSNELTDYFPR